MNKKRNKENGISFSQAEDAMSSAQTEQDAHAYENDRSTNTALYDSLAELAAKSKFVPRSGQFEYSLTKEQIRQLQTGSSAMSLSIYFESLLNGPTKSARAPLPDFLAEQVTFSRVSEDGYLFSVGAAARVALITLKSIFLSDRVAHHGYEGQETKLPDQARLLEELSGTEVYGNNGYDIKFEQALPKHTATFTQNSENYSPNIIADANTKRMSMYELLTAVMEKVQAELKKVVANHELNDSLASKLEAHRVFGVRDLDEDRYNLPSAVKEAILSIQTGLRAPTKQEISEAYWSNFKWICLPLVTAIVIMTTRIVYECSSGQQLPEVFERDFRWLYFLSAVIAIERSISSGRYAGLKRKQKALLEGDLAALFTPEQISAIKIITDLNRE